MKLIINVPEDYYGVIKKIDDDKCTADMLIIKYGIPIPKGHGRIVDISKIEYLKAIHDAKYGKIPWSEAIKRIKKSAPTIIETDTESEDKCKNCEYSHNPDYTRCHECKA